MGSRLWSGVGEIYFEGKNVNFYWTCGFCWSGIIYASIMIARTLNSYVFPEPLWASVSEDFYDDYMRLFLKHLE